MGKIKTNIKNTEEALLVEPTVDEILDKISDKGIDTLTKIEKETHSNRSKGVETNLTFNRVDGDNLLGVRFVF